VLAAITADARARADEQQPQPQLRQVALEDCIAAALEHNPDARSSALDVDAATATRSGTRGELLPKLHADGTLFEWNGPFQLPFGSLGTFQVRDAFTWSTTVTLMQPLTGFLATYDRFKVEDIGVDVAAIQREVTKRDVAFQVAEAYLRVNEAKRLDEVAKASVTQLESQQKQAATLFDNGVIGKNDRLRADLALATARQREIQARGSITLARGRLATLMGIGLDAAIDPIPFAGEPPPLESGSLEQAQTRAAQERTEVRAVTRRIDQGDAAVSAAKWRLLPQISAVGSYLHNEGSAFQQKDSAYVGLVGSWDVWDWGTTTSAISSAETRHEQAKLAKVKLEDEVRYEARQAFVNADTAKEALAVARTAVEQAEENYRIVSKRFEQNAGTSFDVVDAEALLTQARGQVEDALYGYLIARLALQRATGAAMPRVR
jgi:outer membrane protein TolC